MRHHSGCNLGLAIWGSIFAASALINDKGIQTKDKKNEEIPLKLPNKVIYSRKSPDLHARIRTAACTPQASRAAVVLLFLFSLLFHFLFFF